jgi:hypothetical protein
MIERPAKSPTRYGRDTPPDEEEIDEVDEYGSVTLSHAGHRRAGEHRRTYEEGI